MTRTHRFTLASVAVLLCTAVAAAILLISRRNHVPMWDGWVYAWCIRDVGRQHLALESLRCTDHVSYSSMLFFGAFQLPSPGSFALMLLASATLFALACAAFLRITELAYPDAEHGLERALLTAGFALNPAVLAAVVQPNIDIAMLPAFLWGAVFIVRRQWVALIAVGSALVFAKESGVLLYVVLVFAFAVAMVLPGPSSTRSPIRALLKLFPLGIPVALFAAYVAYRIIVPHTVVLSAPGTTDESILYQFLVPRIDPYLVSYLALIFVLGFAWVPTLAVVSDVAVAISRKVRGLAPRPLSGSKRRVVRFVGVLGAATIYMLTRYSSYANTRYLLPAFALLSLIMYAAVVRLGIPVIARRSLLGAIAVLALISTVRTVDPVSRATWGTFRFGDHAMLRMTHFTRECCGAGQDQLAYNLQFTALSALLGDITASVVDDSTAIIVPPRMTWHTVDDVDATTRRPTLRRGRTFTPPVFGADTLRLLTAPTRRLRWAA
jgi:hypothetical protein